MPVPSEGRIVHYVSHGTPIKDDGTQAYISQCRAAVIAEVGQGPTPGMRILNPGAQPPVGLCVLNPTGLFFHPLADGGCDYDEGTGVADWSCDGANHAGGTWHWPARMEA